MIEPASPAKHGSDGKSHQASSNRPDRMRVDMRTVRDEKCSAENRLEEKWDKGYLFRLSCCPSQV